MTAVHVRRMCCSSENTGFIVPLLLPVPGVYCSGWLKRGPSGIIGSNIADAKETVGVLLEDAHNNTLPPIAVQGGLESVGVAARV